MNVNELRARQQQLEAELSTVREELAARVPKPLHIEHLRLKAGAAFLNIEIAAVGGMMLKPPEAAKVRDWLLAAYPLDPAPDAGWVSVDERLPETDKPVLAFVLGIPVAAFKRADGSWLVGWNHDKIGTPVTHWRELPAPPAS